MVVCVKRWRACLAAVVVVVVAIILVGCKINGRVDLRADGGTKIELTFEDADGMMAKIHQTCEGVRLTFEAALTFVSKPKVEDVTPPGGHLTCRLTSNEPFGGHVRFIRKGDRYSFEYPGAHDGDDDLSDLRTRIVITMPGRVVKSSLGSVRGHQVFIENLDFLTYGLSIEAEVGGSSASSSAKGGSVVSSSGGVPVWVWTGVAGGVLVVVGVVVVALRRRKHRAVPVSRDLGPAGFGPTAGRDGPPGAGPVSSVLWPEAGQDGTSQANAGMSGGDQDPHSRYRPR